MDDSNKNYDSLDSDSIFNAETMPAKHAAATAKRFKTGDLIMNRYKVLSELGQGGMGVVYKCFDETAGIEIALKALPPELSHNTLEMEDIKDNFQIVHNLHHPNIAAYNTLERDPLNGNYYLIMECCEGEDLRRWIKRKRRDGELTINDVQPIVKQIADALDYAHEQKIIHRDIKPGNIMIDATGKIKVLDFGLAAQIHTSMTRVSMVNYGTSGTGPYMAPEQWRGRKQGAAADQYSLAVMAYEMLSGDLPFESPDPAVLKQAVLDETPDSIPDVPDHINAAILRAMSKDAATRFESCFDFANALSTKKSVSFGKEHSPGSQENGEFSQVYSGNDQAVKECPWCGELIKAKAKICRFCQHDLTEGPRSDVHTADTNTAGELIAQTYFQLLPGERLLDKNTVAKKTIPAVATHIRLTNKRLVFCDISKWVLGYGVFLESDRITAVLLPQDIVDITLENKEILFIPVYCELKIKQKSVDIDEGDTITFVGNTRNEKALFQKIYQWWYNRTQSK